MASVRLTPSRLPDRLCCCSAVSLAAGFLSARRAATIDPMEALH
jgi:hypothetical protein